MIGRCARPDVRCTESSTVLTRNSRDWIGLL